MTSYSSRLKFTLIKTALQARWTHLSISERLMRLLAMNAKDEVMTSLAKAQQEALMILTSTKFLSKLLEMRTSEVYLRRRLEQGLGIKGADRGVRLMWWCNKWRLEWLREWPSKDKEVNLLEAEIHNSSFINLEVQECNFNHFQLDLREDLKDRNLKKKWKEIKQILIRCSNLKQENSLKNILILKCMRLA